jgi:NADPH-dependent curcumin reductase CurA
MPLSQAVGTTLEENEVLLEVDTISLDPYMRARTAARDPYAKPTTPLGAVMPGQSVARVLPRRPKHLPAGPGHAGWAFTSGWQELAHFRVIDARTDGQLTIRTRRQAWGTVPMGYEGLDLVSKPARSLPPAGEWFTVPA